MKSQNKPNLTIIATKELKDSSFYKWVNKHHRLVLALLVLNGFIILGMFAFIMFRVFSY